MAARRITPVAFQAMEVEKWRSSMLQASLSDKDRDSDKSSSPEFDLG
jgi:hypothetical protein